MQHHLSRHASIDHVPSTENILISGFITENLGKVWVTFDSGGLKI